MTNDETHRATQSEIRQYVERYERLEAEKKDIADHQKEVMSEAKLRGYDTAILKQVIARRKKSAEDLAEQEALLSMYEEAMGNG
jgi:uncharacterized protein (UPF0335 family)